MARIRRIEAEGLGPFRKIDITLAPRTTVLAGPNGMGKPGPGQAARPPSVLSRVVAATPTARLKLLHNHGP